mgnify:CR=1 FL=1
MAKYGINMSDQLNKVRVNAREKLEKEAEVVVEIQKPSALQTAAASHLSKKEEPHPLGSPKNLNEMKKVEIKLNRGNVDKDIQKIVKHIGLVNKKRRPNQQIKITQNMSDDSVTLDGGKNVDIDREVADIRNFIGYKSAKVVESVNEGKMSQLHTYIKQGKTAKEIGKLMGVDPKTIQKLMDAYDVKNESVDLDEAEGSIIIPKTAAPSTVAGLVSLSKKKGLKVTSQEKRKDGGTTIQLKGNQRVILDIQGAVASRKGYKTEETLDEREKSVRQLINPTKEVMVVKKNKVVVIDKKDQDKYIKQGWTLAEETELEEARWKVKIEGLPPIYMDSSSAGEVKSQLRKLLKKPDMIQDIERVTDAEVKKGLRDRISGKEVEEQSNDTKGE